MLLKETSFAYLEINGSPIESRVTIFLCKLGLYFATLYILRNRFLEIYVLPHAWQNTKILFFFPILFSTFCAINDLRLFRFI